MISRELLEKMAEAEDKAKSIAVGGFIVDAGFYSEDECQNCGIGYYLPSGVCDHCNVHMTVRLNSAS